jgi:peptide/nickel transport system permease protein
MNEILRMFWNRKIAFVGLLVLIVVILMGLLSPLIAPYDPLGVKPEHRLQVPNGLHLFGTDNFGRDILSRVIYGARMSLISSAGVVAFSGFFGVVIGMFSGYFRKVDIVLMRVIDVLMAFPPLLLALVFMAILGRSVFNVILAVGATYLTRTVRIVYGLTMKIKEEVYIEAFRSAGATDFRLLLRHILPNLASPIIVQTSFTFAFSLLDMAALDYLGLGIPPEIPSWGNMLSEGSIYLTRAPWLLLFPGIFIVLTVFSFNLAGDVLRDHLDPRFRRDISGV